ncbi:MAG: cupin domain-containing protein [Phaeodactylibacter sp.]|nr:cupin domain-containing protein [Phaeodactylibacter sp.]
MEISAINLEEKLSLFSEHWSPRIIGELNGQLVKLAKIQGEFVWHSHAEEDELFMVLKGRLIMELRDKIIEAGPGELIIIPKGTEHLPRTRDGEEIHILLFEPKSTLNTGELENERTRRELEWI